MISYQKAPNKKLVMWKIAEEKIGSREDSWKSQKQAMTSQNFSETFSNANLRRDRTSKFIFVKSSTSHGESYFGFSVYCLKLLRSESKVFISNVQNFQG